MKYYSADAPLVYHSCENCSIGKAIPTEKRLEGKKPEAELCAECDDRKLSGTCEGRP